jgi:hypothetical protein
LALTPSGRRVAAAGILSLAALVCSSCATASTSITAETSLADQLASLAQPLDCASTYPLYDDVYHESSMRGVICVDGDGAITQLRTYTSPLAVTVALQDWALDHTDQWLLMDANWFAIGSRAQIDAVAAHSELQTDPTQDLPALPSDYQPNPLDECVQFVSSTANTFLTDPSQFDTDRTSLDQVIAGVTSEIESLMRQPTTAELRSLSPDDMSFESEFSRLGPEMKAFCRDSIPNDRSR